MTYFLNIRHMFVSTMLMLFGLLGIAHAQQDFDANNQPFASENAILDTSIPFAIGAHEAQQSIRGAFGWPTFQEGLVQGVYFRFDPDGYARFAPTPRLDSDVFEVICRPRTYACMGRKGTLSLILNSRGQIQLKIDDILQGDRFFVSEGVSEIEVPDRILQPLGTQLELLLSTGGDLIVRRGDKEKDRISLTSFHPVSAYLRWVTARQDYTILPRGWPVPNSSNTNNAITQNATWQSPMPQPQNFPYGQQGLPNSGAVNQQVSSQQGQSENQITGQSLAQINAQTEVAEVKGELKILRELLLERNQALAPQQQQNPSNDPFAPIQQIPKGTQVSDQIAALQEAAEQIQADLARLSSPQPSPQSGLGRIQMSPVQTHQSIQPQEMPSENTVQPDSATEMAQRLQYLMNEIGLDAKTALMLIQMGERQSSTQPAQNNQGTMQAMTLTHLDGRIQSTEQSQRPLYQESVVAQILSELEGELSQRNDGMAEQSNMQTLSDQDYQLLSDYFRSVALPTR